MGRTDLPSFDKRATGENIKRLMRLNHYSVTQLQLELGMSSLTNIYRWCRGELTPSPDRLLHLAKLFNCTVDDILIQKED